jgi:Xaa-Pro dipeptidase
MGQAVVRRIRQIAAGTSKRMEGGTRDPLPRLLEAQRKAWRLFAEAQQRGFIAPGQLESELNLRMHRLARDMFGVRRHWHKRIVRAGANTLLPYRKDPPDLAIGEDCILFFDFGPVFEAWEADVGMTYVLGNDPHKHRLAADTLALWLEGKTWFDAHPQATGAQLYAHTQSLARSRGWEFGGPHCGHLVGRFPHERIAGEAVTNYIHPDNGRALRGTDGAGVPRHWIYEVHLIDRAAGIGGFFEQLLTAPMEASAGPATASGSLQSRLQTLP